MYFWGLHIVDLCLIAVYLAAMIWIGRKVGQATEGMDDFFLAGRKLGKVYQFFLNFGCSTNADQAVAVSREVYRQGIGGMWIQSLVLFLTPFYWFTDAALPAGPADHHRRLLRRAVREPVPGARPTPSSRSRSRRSSAAASGCWWRARRWWR